MIESDAATQPPLCVPRRLRLLVRPRHIQPTVPVLSDLQEVDIGRSPRNIIRLIIPPALRVWRTKPDAYGRYRDYPYRPSVIPNLSVASAPRQTFENGQTLSQPIKPILAGMKSLAEALGPFRNTSEFYYAKWQWVRAAATRSPEAAARILAEEFFPLEDFDHKLIANVKDWDAVKRRVASYCPNPFLPSEGWKEEGLTISIPLGKTPTEDPDAFPCAVPFEVRGFQRRNIVDVIRKILGHNPLVKDLHLYPYREYVEQRRLGDKPLRIIDDVFNSDFMLNEFDKLQKSPPVPGCTLERIIISLQFWSDATCLATFGTAKLWPLYMSILNQPKVLRDRPDLNLMTDIGYFPTVSNRSELSIQYTNYELQLPESFDDFVVQSRGQPPSDDLRTHCRRELFHAGWLLLMDAEFVKAWREGVVMPFIDGVVRRVIFRINGYSADYPEK